MEDPQEPRSRARKGSLRKTVLLGVERMRGDRRSSLSNSSSNARRSPTKHLPESKAAPKPFVFELPNSSTESYATDNNSNIHGSTASENASAEDMESAIEANTHDILSPTSTNNTVSDEDVLTFPPSIPASNTGVSALDGQALRPQTLFPPPITALSPSPSPPSSESSGPASFSITADSPSSVRRRRSTLRPLPKGSPLTATPAVQTLPPIEEEWDYSETEWWGWIILIVTWIVFVVGMGSCLGIWSWAWDVGETPYAPPELEDDPTLPIVGYYPALMVLTAVMSWVWVVVAWVGLKYFKHAKMGVLDDG